ncbi:lipoxygenase10 [Zea mays]|uniref:Lipoxygenase10 n=1 Tax=Zea mays TaxID=4577 RepID=A0A1D6QRG2_MAIZE|nr:lipoxygenase10 [Zea mays]
MREGHNYVPRDEQFSEVKQLTFGATTLRSGLHALLPALRPLLINKKDLRFPHFPAIDDLFSDGIPLPAQTGFDAIRTVVPRMVKLVEDTTDHVLRFEVPEMIERDRFSWFKDEEFARQTIAGLNPLCIQLLTEFPIKSKLDPEVYGPAESAITKEILEKQMNGALTVEQALAAKRLFILDYHDVFLPYVHKVRELQDATLYASRTIFFLTDLGTLMPLAIELTRPKSPTRPQWKRAFTHGPDATDAWLWKLAKAHVLTHDTGYHQLVSHWQFDTEALPNDLIKRGLAVRGEDGELELTIKDYPYAHDGLLVWDSIRQWASEYVNVYYKSDEAVAADPELRAFWDEVRNVGHGDKKDEPWWPVLDTRDSLVETLTTIMWVTSGHHSAVNFGQYHFAGYFPNRPTTIRKNMPVEEGGPGEEMEKFLKQPETTLLDMLPTQMQAIKVMTTLDILSSHSPDEEYMGEFAEPSWLAEPMVKAAFEKFGGRMKEIEGFIDECNNNLDLKNRCGAGIVPYELLKPFSKPGVTGRGIPSSISI